MLRGIWTCDGDYCLACAVKRYGWANRRRVIAFLRENEHGCLPDSLARRRIVYDAATDTWTTVKNKRSWYAAVVAAIIGADLRDGGGDDLDPWRDDQETPRRIFCTDCGVDLGIEPYCVKDNPEEHGLESCDCWECNPDDIPKEA